MSGEPNARDAVHCVLTLLGLAAKVSAGVVSAEASSAFGTGPKPERHYAPASKGPCNRLELVGVPTPHAGPLNRDTIHGISRLITHVEITQVDIITAEPSKRYPFADVKPNPANGIHSQRFKLIMHENYAC